MAIFSFPILIGLLVLVAVLADRITFDCTSMNEQIQSNGVGLLQSLGFVQSERKQPTAIANKVELADEAATDKLKKKSNSRRKHNPGVWVLYFALVALPLFGLGQLFIEDPADRRWAFTYLFFYLLSSLFLLVLISLLSLRKYLRERGVPMEQSFAIRWLALGMASVFAVLFFLSLLPTPSLSFLSMDLPFRFTSPDDLEASEWGWGNEGAPGDGPRNAPPNDANGDQPKDQEPAGPKPPPGNDGKPNNNEPNGQKDGKSQSKGGSKEDGKQDGKDGKQDGDSKNGNRQGDQAKVPGEQKNGDQKGNSEDKSNAPNKTQDEPEERKQKPEPGADKKNKQQPGNEDPPKGENPDQKEPNAAKPPKDDSAPKKQDRPQDRQQGDKPREQPDQPKPPQPPPSMSIQWNFSAALQWLLMLTLAIVAIVFGIKYRHELVRSIQNFREWLSALFGGKRKPLIVDGQVAEVETTIADLYPPFSSFANPFAAGTGWSREQIVRQMYRAILSWGYEQRVVMRDDETPEEFIRRLARRFPEQHEQLSLLGVFYNRIAYARGTIASKEIAPMAELWRWLSDRRTE